MIMGWYNNELCHHGIRGQKWGVRRFQNEDGSLTAEGKERYGKMLDAMDRTGELDKKLRQKSLEVDAYRKSKGFDYKTADKRLGSYYFDKNLLYGPNKDAEFSKLWNQEYRLKNLLGEANEIAFKEMNRLAIEDGRQNIMKIITNYRFANEK